MNLMCISALILFFFTPMHAQNMPEIFLQANEAYQKGAISQAIKSYESIDPKGEAVWFNLAMAYAQQQNHVEALYSLLNAERQATWQTFDEIALQIDQTKNMLADRDAKDASIIMRILFKVTTICSLLVWQLLVMAMSFFVLLSLFLFDKRKKILHYAQRLLIVCLICSIILLLMKYQLLYRKIAIVMQESQSYIAPDEHFSAKEKLPVGTIITILDQKDDWFHVKHADHIGWLHAKYMRLVQPPEFHKK